MCWGFADYIFEGECEAIALILPLNSYYFNYKTQNHYLKKGKKYRIHSDSMGEELTRFLKNYTFKIVSNGKVNPLYVKGFKFKN